MYFNCLISPLTEDCVELKCQQFKNTNVSFCLSSLLRNHKSKFQATVTPINVYWYIFHSFLSKQNWRHDGRACIWVNATVPIPSFPSREIQACLVGGINLWHVKVCKKQKSFLNCTGSPYSYRRPLPPILASTVPSGTQVGFAYQQINQHSIPQTGKLLKIKSP